MLRAVIIDDEQAGIETLRILALRNADLIRIVSSTLVPEEAVTMIEDFKPDVVFLDISMPTMNGFEVLARISHRDFKLVFTTAHREYAIEAIKNKAYDYLLKPISDNDFKKCIGNILKDLKEVESKEKRDPLHFLELQVKDGINYIRQKDIIRLEASRSYTVIYLDNGKKHVASKSIKDFEPKLDPLVFFRCHKSHIVNLQKVQKFVNHNGFFVEMCDGVLVDISRAQKDVFLERLKIV